MFLAATLSLVLALAPAAARPLHKGKEYAFNQALYCYTRDAVAALAKSRREGRFGEVPDNCEIGSISQFVPEYRIPLLSFPMATVVAEPEKGDVPCTNRQTLEIRYCRISQHGMIAGYATRNDGQLLLLYVEVADDVEVEAAEQPGGSDR